MLRVANRAAALYPRVRVCPLTPLPAHGHGGWSGLGRHRRVCRERLPCGRSGAWAGAEAGPCEPGGSARARPRPSGPPCPHGSAPKGLSEPVLKGGETLSVSPGQCCSVAEVSASAPQGCRFGSLSRAHTWAAGGIPTLVRVRAGGNRSKLLALLPFQSL